MTIHYGTTDLLITACGDNHGGVTDDSTKVSCSACVGILSDVVEATADGKQRLRIHYRNTQGLIMCSGTLGRKFVGRQMPIIGLVTCKNCLRGIKREQKRATCAHPVLHGFNYAPTGSAECEPCGAIMVVYPCKVCILDGCDVCCWVGYHIGPRLPERELSAVNSL